MSKPTLSVVMPALNEEANVRAAAADAVQCLADRFADWEILLVDDGSTDRTGAIMDELAGDEPRFRVIHNPRPRNLGGIYKQAIELARHEYLVMIPGDGENPGEAMQAAFDAIGQADMVLPYPVNPEARSPVRNLISRSYVELLNALFGLDIRYYNGTVIHRVDNLRQIEIATDGFAYQSEVLIKLLRLHKSYVEVPVRIDPKPGSQSKAFRVKNIVGVGKALADLFVEVRIRGSRERAHVS